ncbi:MAG: hypothetical protein HC781_01590 [Leptolyngbyaceae cyanobacterium CSU_1_4]|nr:hypothetical protein [Leptolyngbyaceae cyanobacterium CSU_1_4]
MAKTVFAPGSVVTSNWLNAVNNPVFVDNPDDDGELARIADNDLSNVAGQIKPEWRAFRDALKVSAGSGLNITFEGGAVTLPLGTILTIAPGTLVMANNATNFVFVNESGAVASSLIYPVVGVMLASVTTVGGTITTIVDLRPRFRVQPVASAIKIFGGTGAQGDYVLSAGSATFSQGTYYYRNFTIGTAAVLTIDKFARIYCSGDVVIDGTINVTTMAAGGVGITSGNSNINLGGTVGSGIGAGLGSGPTYNYAAAPYGSGGASGLMTGGVGSAGEPGSGGRGGGGIWLEAGNTITVNGTINALGGSGTAGTVSAGTPTLSGAGGGSGGLILLSALRSIIASATSTLDVRGGAGGNGLNNGTGGGGGGGGQVVAIAPSINTTGSTIRLTGGAAGITSGTGVLGGGGGGGFGGSGGAASGTTAQTGGTGQLVIRNFAAVG